MGERLKWYLFSILDTGMMVFASTPAQSSMEALRHFRNEGINIGFKLTLLVEPSLAVDRKQRAPLKEHFKIMEIQRL